MMSKTIVMIHGMWGGSWYWHNFKQFFEEKGYECLTPVLRYHDVDPKDAPHPELGTTSLLDYAGDLEEYIGKLEEKPIIMGHSMGGLLAQMLGARGLAESLVLLTPASPRGVNALKVSVIRSFWDVMTKWNIMINWGFWRRPHRLSFERAVYAMLHLLPGNERKSAYERMVSESGLAAFEIGFWLVDFSKATHVDQAKITCPVLVVSGAEDRITPASVVKNVAKKYNALDNYKKFKNHAHWVIGEPGWEEIAEYVFNWVDRIENK